MRHATVRGSNRTGVTTLKGTTLLELVMATSIFLLLCTALYLCFIQGFRLYQGEQFTSSFRQAAVALDRMARELGAGAESLYLSGEYDLSPPGTPSLTFRTYNPVTDQREVVSYRFNPATHEVRRVTGEAGAPLDAGVQPSQLLATGVEGLSFFTLDDGLLRIGLTLPGRGNVLRTTVQGGSLPKE